MPYPSKPKNQLLDPNLGEQLGATPGIRPATPERPVAPSQGTAGAPRLATSGAPRVSGSPWNREKVPRPHLQQETLNVGVVAPPMWTAEQVLAHPQLSQVAKRLREQLVAKQDKLSEKDRLSGFWPGFREQPESVAARMVSYIMSELTAGDRNAAFPNLGPDQRSYLENSPISRWLDWTDYVNAKEGGSNG